MDSTNAASVVNTTVFSVGGVNIDWGHIGLAVAAVLLALR